MGEGEEALSHTGNLPRPSWLSFDFVLEIELHRSVLKFKDISPSPCFHETSSRNRTALSSPKVSRFCSSFFLIIPAASSPTHPLLSPAVSCTA
ncbi:hypothetical protein AVEN_93554-1 [Araneus ventricosus]|uniref:Uncharacterized protein n=1 Tax=Araneus ventricosus TaxID=182803 RepID=A0A4Y2APP7_ARAVE|nr:hypothetical protein AVEN_93554-1 [Araneus ventricosus]